MPEEDDLEDYLARIKRRWDSSLLTDEQNEKRWKQWMKERDNETPSE